MSYAVNEETTYFIFFSCRSHSIWCKSLFIVYYMFEVVFLTFTKKCRIWRRHFWNYYFLFFVQYCQFFISWNLPLFYFESHFVEHWSFLLQFTLQLSCICRFPKQFCGGRWEYSSSSPNEIINFQKTTINKILCSTYRWCSQVFWWQIRIVLVYQFF